MKNDSPPPNRPRARAGRGHALIARWSRLPLRRPALVVAACGLAAVLLAAYAAMNLGIDTSTDKLMQPDGAYREARDAYRAAFPGSGRELVIVVEARTPEMAHAATSELHAWLRARPELFAEIEWPGEGEFFRRNRLLYLDRAQIESLTDRLALAQPLLARLADEPTLPRLFDTLQLATDRESSQVELDVAPILDAVADSMRSVRLGGRDALSWSELMAGESVDIDRRRQILLLYPSLDSGRWLASATAVEAIREAAAELDLEARFAADVSLTGPVALAYDERRTLTDDGTTIAVLALLMVACVLAVGMRSARLIVVSLACLAGGLAATAAFAAATVGSLNMISIAFAALYIGLGIDYAIHYCLRFRENLDAGNSLDDALAATTAMLAPTLLVCAASSAIGFYCFIPTAYKGLSELGLIAGTGMLVSFLLSVTALPAAIKLSGFRRTARPGALLPLAWLRPLAMAPERHRPAYRVAALVLVALGISALPIVDFDSNPLNLRSPESESVSTLQRIEDDPRFQLRSVNVLARDAAEERRLSRQLESLSLVGKVTGPADLVPADQDEKLALLFDLALILGPGALPDVVEPGRPRPPPESAAALRALAATLRAYPSASAGRELGAEIGRFLAASESLPPGARAGLWQRLRHALLATLPPAVEQLGASLQAARVSEDNLPQSLRAKWIGLAGQRRLLVAPSESLDARAGQGEFVEQIRSVTAMATGRPVAEHAAGESIAGSFRQALAIAIAAIALVVLSVFRRIGDSLRVLGILMFSALLTTAATVPLGLSFNFANVIAIPLLLGLSVDTTIHLVERWRQGGVSVSGLLETTTARAVVISALTTMCGFSNLAFADHRGIASMGLLLFAGTLIMLASNLQILPALLPARPRVDNTPRG